MKLDIVKDNIANQTIEVSNEDLVNGNNLYIGREDDCHIILESPQVSRHHAIMSFDDKKLWIETLSDSAILKVNGAQVTKSEIFENTKIEIFNYLLTVTDLPIVEVEENPEEIVESNNELDLKEEQSSEFDQEENNEIKDSNEEELENIVEGSSEEESNFEMDNDETTMDFGAAESEGDDELGSDFNEEATDAMDVEEGLGLDELNESDNDFESSDDNEFSNDNEENDFHDNNDPGDSLEENDNFGEDNFGENNFGDDNFGDDNFADDGFGSNAGGSEEATQLVQSFAKYSLKLFGEYAPFDRFAINEAEVFIGRDPEKCQIVLDDPEVSKVHAVINRTMLNYTLQDLDSSNGIILNGERINKAEISNGDEFLIGDTTFTVMISSDIIEAEKDILMPVEDNQEVEIEEIVEEEVDYDEFQDPEEEEEEKSFIKRILKDPKKKKIVIGLIILVGFLSLLEDDTAKLEEGTKDNKDKKELVKKEVKNKAKFSEETIEKLEANYSLAVANFKKGELYQAKEFLDIVMSTDPNFKDAQTMAKLIQEGLDREVRLKEKEQTEAERRERQLKIAALVEKAKEAVKNREVEVARNYFNQIFEIDPENIDVPPLKLEIEAYVEDKKRKEQEEALKKARRQAKVNKLNPARTIYLKGDWFKAVAALEKFLEIEDMDEDLTQDATNMLKDSRKKLLQIINPLLSKARSYKEGQDLKQAYEIYGEVLRYDPVNEESLNQRDEIFTTLKNRSMKVYREALVAESLSLYSKAKEKFQEVQQISPINSEYYNKATEKLKGYLE